MIDLSRIFEPLIVLFSGLATWQIFLLLTGLIGVLGFITFNILVISKFFKEFFGFFKKVRKAIFPAKWDSPATLIWLSIFSWAVSRLTGEAVQNIITFIGWLFLIPGVHWLLHEDKTKLKFLYQEKTLKKWLTIGDIFIGSWITGALVSYFLFAKSEEIPAIAYIAWPCISAILAGAPKFIKSDPVDKTPIYKTAEPKDRQYLVLLALINLLLSCWIQLTFSTENWLAEYPSLLADDLGGSSFVVRTQPESVINSRGVNVLRRTETVLEETLEGQTWSNVERWLLNLEPRVAELESIVIDQLPSLRENSFWQIRGRILTGEYAIQLFAIWRGPSADPNGYYLTKTCQITQVTPQKSANDPLSSGRASSNLLVGTARVECGPTVGPIKGQPELAAR